MIQLSKFNAQQLVFIDESRSNECTGDRRNGWAPKGCPVIVKQLLKRTPKWSILLAYTVDGYILTVLFQGSINIKQFKDFIINFVLPRCTPFPSWNSVLVIDNCSIHHSNVIAAACACEGILLQYLLLYSLDFNPIEYSFYNIKAWIRHN